MGNYYYKQRGTEQLRARPSDWSEPNSVKKITYPIEYLSPPNLVVRDERSSFHLDSSVEVKEETKSGFVLTNSGVIARSVVWEADGEVEGIPDLPSRAEISDEDLRPVKVVLSEDEGNQGQAGFWDKVGRLGVVVSILSGITVVIVNHQKVLDFFSNLVGS